ncbi:MAG: prepilin-type N-terminal cleavage/methylation domain-containing protein [Actinobacteria bacterium]|nr:prepilin-type N-terminal cleavage/methylation domain-containing protein [Actinomycetota bacterium]
MKSFLKETGSESGFTIIELMIVLCIIAILVGIVTLSMTVVRMKVREGACQANLKTLENMIEHYKILNDGKPPPDLDTLVVVGDLKRVPTCPTGGPTGGNYKYDSATGEVSCPKHKL